MHEEEGWTRWVVPPYNYWNDGTPIGDVARSLEPRGGALADVEDGDKEGLTLDEGER